MQDSSYTNSKIPLWVFDIGIFIAYSVGATRKLINSFMEILFYHTAICHFVIHLFSFIFFAVKECWINWKTGTLWVNIFYFTRLAAETLDGPFIIIVNCFCRE